MMLIEAEVPELTARSRSLQLSHTAAGLPRALEPGEPVVLHSGEEHWTAWVVDLDFTLDDTLYRLELGRRVPAPRREERPTAGDPPRVDVEDVVSMLETLRGAGAWTAVPQRRRSTARLLREG